MIACILGENFNHSLVNKEEYKQVKIQEGTIRAQNVETKKQLVKISWDNARNRGIQWSVMLPLSLFS